VVEGALLPPPRAGRRLCCGQGRMMVAVARCNFPSFSLPSEQISQKKIVRLISSKMSIESTLTVLYTTGYSGAVPLYPYNAGVLYKYL
jgi:hypothetical protein